MEQSHINITGQNKVDGAFITWSHAVPVHNFTIQEHDGVQFALIERTYWRDSKTGKIRYRTHNCDNASYDHLFNIYIQISPDVYAYAGIASGDGVQGKLARAVENFKGLTQDTIDTFVNSIVRH